MNSVEQLAKDLSIIGSYFKKRMYSEKFEECNIKDCMTIETLSQGDLPMLKLSQMLDLSPSATTTHIDRLIEYKVVERKYNENDRRKVFITLSKKGNDIGFQIQKKHLEISKDMLKALTKEEAETYKILIRKVASHLFSGEDENFSLKNSSSTMSKIAKKLLENDCKTLRKTN